MRKWYGLAILTAILCLLMIGYNISGMAASDARQTELASGTCGDNLTWVLTDDGVLTISGSGDMYDYSSYDPRSPWYDYKENITSLVIGDGVNTIGNCAFHGCGSLSAVTISNSVTAIGSDAFAECKGLIGFAVPEGVTTIGGAVFSGCTNLKSITIPNSVTTIGAYAFNGCSSLVSVELPDSITFIDGFMFQNCWSLTCITIPDSILYINRDAFADCNALWHVLYTGTESQWNNIVIYQSTSNSGYCLKNAIRHYDWTGEYEIDAENQYCYICPFTCFHQWDEGTVIKEPTCGAKGEKLLTCTLCGDTRTEEFYYWVNHSFDNYIYVDEYYHNAICSVCGFELQDFHYWDEGTVLKPPCTEDGLISYHCRHCTATKEKTVEMTGHNYEAVMTDPTCTEDGITTHTCTGCGDSWEETVAAIGHIFGEWTQVKAPTTEETGLEERYCANCGNVEQRELAKLEPEPTEPAPTEPEPTESTPPETKPTEPEPTESAPLEPKPTEPALTEPAGNQKGGNGETVIIVVIALVCVTAGGAVAAIWKSKRNK